MAECNLSTLLADACTNGFSGAADNELMFRAILMQLACNQTSGAVLTSPNGTRYRIVVANDGTLSTEPA